MKQVQEWHADDATATEQRGYEFGLSVTKPTAIALVGEMGAGKTHWAKGFAKGLGYDGEVTSPTFALVQEYRGGRWPIFHFDWYRLRQPEEVLQLGWDDYCDEPGILLVEWANLFPQLWPESMRVMEITHLEQGRKIALFEP